MCMIIMILFELYIGQEIGLYIIELLVFSICYTNRCYSSRCTFKLNFLMVDNMPMTE